MTIFLMLTIIETTASVPDHDVVGQRATTSPALLVNANAPTLPGLVRGALHRRQVA
jgi:hypothetical protein